MQQLDNAQHWVNILLADDCQPDEQLDQIVKQAAMTFHVPIVLINVATSSKLVFKAAVGHVQADCLERDGSFCDVTLEQDAPLMVVDASTHALFKNHEHVVGALHIRSYLGRSLHAADGTKVATICLLDTKTHSYTKRQHDAFNALAESAERQLIQLLRIGTGHQLSTFTHTPINAHSCDQL